jgi:hypothetical protein
MTLLDIPLAVVPSTRALRAQADVIEVDEGRGFCASVLVVPGSPPVARLDRSINGAPHEGAVLRWVMLRTTGLFGWGYFVYRLVSETLC